MNIEYKNAKNNELTVTADSIYLHSSYSPSKEAQSFVNSLNLTFSPRIIFITEPALSYCIAPLKDKYPDSKICAIRYTDSFEKYDGNWDFVIKYYEQGINFSDFLLNSFGEEILSLSVFLQWKASAKVFSEIDYIVWNEIKNVIQKSNTLLVTRENFERKWFLNTVYFLKYSNNLKKIYKKTNLPVLIVASGPSLKPLIPYIQENQDNFFILCLSSALSVLEYHKIEPDLVLSTDGGFWAGEHLKPVLKHNYNLAIPTEAYVKKSIYEKSAIIPLAYKDGLSYRLLNSLHISFMEAVRNGTVSGTALYLAQNITSGKIFFTGLDLASQKGHQHTQPNIIENHKYSKINKITQLEKTSVASEFNTYSLDVYSNWFKTIKLEENRFFRIIESQNKKNSFNHIKDISVSDFKEYVENRSDSKDLIQHTKLFSELSNKEIFNAIITLADSQEWLRELFPLSYTSLLRNPGNLSIQNKLKEKNSRLLKKIGKLFNE